MRVRTHTRVTRREFTGVLCAATALPALGAAQTGVPAQPDYVPPPRPLVADEPPFAEPFEFTRTVVAAKVEPFPLTNVRLLPSNVFHDAQEWNRGYMARLAADRLLYTFRVNAGLPVGSARPLGGWEQPENGRRSSELRGHFAGHFLSASALLYASTGDAEARSKADYMVGELVLAGDLGADGLTENHIVGPNLRSVQRTSNSTGRRSHRPTGLPRSPTSRSRPSVLPERIRARGSGRRAHHRSSGRRGRDPTCGCCR